MSGIYIKMPMPIVPQTIIIYPDGTVADVYDGEKYKAIPVPDHGRLVDADAIINSRFEIAILEVLGDAPTIIPANKEA